MLSLSKHLYRVVAQHPSGVVKMLRRLSMTFFLVTALLPAYAQLPAAPRVYTYVERMPQLPGGGGMAAVAAEFQKRLRFPAADLREHLTGRILVYFEVSSAGEVQHVKLLHAIGSAALDSAATATAKTLPRFTPGYQNGRPVTVGLTLPLTICLQ